MAVRTGGFQPAGRGAASSRVVLSSCTMRSPPGRSNLLTTNTSAISITPALKACTASPAAGVRMSTVVSATRAMSTSLCPTPTVSTKMRSNPKASNRARVATVAPARPPRAPRLASERMYTPWSWWWRIMRMRSPRMAPPVKGLLGSTASTATRSPRLRASSISRSVRVLLPAPGLPVRPTTLAWPRPRSCRSRACPSG